jgi:carbon-monoxide dehydrogenase small subunit
MMFQMQQIGPIQLDINGAKISAVVRPADTLLYALREVLGLTAAKPGCENGDCGSCTVLVDGLPVKSCLMLAVEAVGHKITTLEGLQDAPIQKAFVEHRAFQCGYCTPGFIMTCQGLIEKHPDADEDTMFTWLESNICRCTSYEEITGAVRSVLNITPE